MCGVAFESTPAAVAGLAAPCVARPVAESSEDLASGRRASELRPLGAASEPAVQAAVSHSPTADHEVEVGRRNIVEGWHGGRDLGGVLAVWRRVDRATTGDNWPARRRIGKVRLAGKVAGRWRSGSTTSRAALQDLACESRLVHS